MEQYYQWLAMICDELDPDRQYPRPEMTFGVVTGGTYNFGAREILIQTGMDEVEMYFTITHEARHWFQHESGMLQEFRGYISTHFGNAYTGYWKGEAFTIAGIRTQREYERLAWEADANEYAIATCARYFSKKAA